MNNILPVNNNQLGLRAPTQGVQHGFTDRNQRNGTEFNQEQGMPPIAQFDEARMNQIIPNQNIIPVRNVAKGTTRGSEKRPKRSQE